jgi:hypothetical protein
MIAPRRIARMKWFSLQAGLLLYAVFSSAEESFEMLRAK